MPGEQVPPFDAGVVITCVTVPHEEVQSLADTDAPRTQFWGGALLRLRLTRCSLSYDPIAPHTALNSVFVAELAFQLNVWVLPLK